MSLPSRLQGTDGIRGRIRPEEGPRGPLETYLGEGFLTPHFFELYAHAFALLLIERGLAKPGDALAVGWDGRDADGVFDSAFMGGLRKAGLNVWALGILPTPAAPLFMLAQGARGAAVLTASHNPADQNGIKLFLPSLGLKFLPADDEALTQKIYALRERDLSQLSMRGDLVGRHEEAWKFFVDQSLKPENSWIEGLDLSQTVLVVDASNGATAALVEPIFGNLGLKDLILTNLQGSINANCGVADIEGQEEIGRDQLEQRFKGYPMLNAFFEAAQRPEIRSGAARLVGLVFDGDGDRCYRLDYDPTSDAALVSSGDLLGFHLARHLAKKSGPGRYFAFTVESDLLLGQAAEALGYKALLTGVGDKWLLRQGAASILRSQLGSDQAALELGKMLETWLQDPAASALVMTQAAELYFAQRGWHEKGALDFALGLEESGHALSAFWLEKEGILLPAFAGNGIKAGLNSLAAMSGIIETQALSAPFEAGLKATHYVYYVDKSKLEPNRSFRLEFTKFLLEALPQVLGPGFTGRIESFAEEPSLLFCHLLKDGHAWGAVFLRNSGTEDKSALYLRGPHAGAAILGQLAELLHVKLLAELKDPNKDLAQLEQALLKAIAQGQDPEAAAEAFAGLPFGRVLKEMELKQGLIRRTPAGLEIDQKGRALL
ncbi:MAG: hypothetical protein RRB13_06300 [bacterium]|nr:hypothetical protein [bacterium]